MEKAVRTGCIKSTTDNMNDLSETLDLNHTSIFLIFLRIIYCVYTCFHLKSNLLSCPTSLSIINTINTILTITVYFCNEQVSVA